MASPMVSLFTPDEILKKIRYDPETKMGSVLDVVQLVTGQRNGSQLFQRITEQYPDVISRCDDFKFPGQGQRPTPVAHVNTLVEIAWLCPGQNAKEFRRTGAVTLCRALGGDLSLVDDIRRRHAEVAGTEEQAAFLEGTGVTTAEANGHALASAENDRSRKLQNDMLEVQIAKMREGAALDTYQRLLELSDRESEERDRLFVKDAARNYFRASFPVSEQLQIEAPSNEPISISGLALDMGLKLKRGDESKVGRVLAQLYRDTHDADPPRHAQFVDGAVRKVNSYFAKDRSLMEQALRHVVG